jgi:hypothetical protein
MSRNRRQDGDTLLEPEEGCVLIGYDADDSEYFWRRRDGAILTGPEGGPLRLHRYPNGDFADPKVRAMFGLPVINPGPEMPCACCGKELAPDVKKSGGKEVEKCDCEAAMCPIGKPGKCVKHCDLTSPRGDMISHWHYDRFGRMIPLKELRPLPQKQALRAMMEEGVLPESFAKEFGHYFEEPKEGKVKGALKSIKIFLKVKK